MKRNHEIRSTTKVWASLWLACGLATGLAACGDEDTGTNNANNLNTPKKLKIASFTISQGTVAPQSAITLSWDVQNFDATVHSLQITANPGGAVSIPQVAKGTVNYTIVADTMFELRGSATGLDDVVATVNVTIEDPNAPKILGFGVSDTTPTLGDQITIDWETQNTVSVEIFDGNDTTPFYASPNPSTAASGNTTFQVTEMSHSLRLVATNSEGTRKESDPLVISAEDPVAARIISFSVSPAGVESFPVDVTLAWEVRGNTDSLVLTLTANGTPVPNFDGSVFVEDNFSVPNIQAATTFELTATNNEGTDTESVTVERIAVQEIEPNEDIGTAAGQTYFLSGGLLSASVGNQNDIDMFQIQLPQNGNIVLETFGCETSGLNTVVILYNSAGEFLSGNYDKSANDVCSRYDTWFDPNNANLSAGTYYVLVAGEHLANAQVPVTTGSYNLEVRFEPTRTSNCGDGVQEGPEFCDDGNMLNGDFCSDVCDFPVISGATTTLLGNLDDVTPAGTFAIFFVEGEQGENIRVTSSDGAGGCAGDYQVGVVHPAIAIVDQAPQAQFLNASDETLPGCGSAFSFDLPHDRNGPGRDNLYWIAARSLNGSAGGPLQLTVEIGNPSCGNGSPEFGVAETCDDGNTIAGDGCSATCQIEAAIPVEQEPNNGNAQGEWEDLGAAASGTPIDATIRASVGTLGDQDLFFFTASPQAGQTVSFSAIAYDTLGAPASCESNLLGLAVILYNIQTQSTLVGSYACVMLDGTLEPSLSNIPAGDYLVATFNNFEDFTTPFYLLDVNVTVQ